MLDIVVTKISRKGPVLTCKLFREQCDKKQNDQRVSRRHTCRCRRRRSLGLSPDSKVPNMRRWLAAAT